MLNRSPKISGSGRHSPPLAECAHIYKGMEGCPPTLTMLSPPPPPTLICNTMNRDRFAHYRIQNGLIMNEVNNEYNNFNEENCACSAPIIPLPTPPHSAPHPRNRDHAYYIIPLLLLLLYFLWEVRGWGYNGNLPPICEDPLQCNKSCNGGSGWHPP